MKLRHDVPLSTVLWYRIGGTARYLIDVACRDDAFRAVEFLERERPEKIFVVGLGSNLVFPDGCFDGAVVRVARETAPSIRLLGDDRVEAFGGAVLDDVIRFAFDHGLTGLEWAGGLPGTFGAGVRGNVGAFGGEIKDTFHEAEVIRFAAGCCGVQRLTHDDMAFSYRESRVKREKDLLVVSAAVRLERSDADVVVAARDVYTRNIAYRQARHPMEYPNCGSVFKNIHARTHVEQVLARWPDIEEKVRTSWYGKVSMGYIIGRLGFAGMRVGGAQVSEKHNNFIVNLGGAAATDVREIIARIQAAVSDAFGFVPEVEIEIVD